MPERLLLAGGLLGLLVLAIALARAGLRWRDRRLIARINSLRTPRQAHEDGPRIVYFTTTTCVVCRAQQEPALAALEAAMPALVVETHDAVEERSLAGEFGVLSVPTTAVYDGDGTLIAINRGFASAAVLLAQLEGREVELEGGQAMTGERIDPPASG